VRFVCVLWSVPHLYETAASNVTELVTNAFEHVQWPDDPVLRIIRLTISVAGPYLTVEVSDPDPRLPVIGGPVDWDSFDWLETDAGDGRGERGFGLYTVAMRVKEAGGEFGVVLTAHGKTVFFALPLNDRVPLASLGVAVEEPARLWEGV
jgi:sensor histidine kinase regulating citrate/malate metabolism